MTEEPSLPPVYRLVALDTVGSTNDEAKRLAARGEDEAPDGTLVWARSQTAGRGRRGRRWISPEGNLYCSLVLRPDVPLAEAVQLGFVAALAIYDATAQLVHPGHQVYCKWPNDVLLQEKKIAGILLESEASGNAVPSWIVLGVGMNVAQYPDGTEFPATSLWAEGCREVTIVDALEAVSRHFLAWTNRWVHDGFEPVRDTWLRRAKGFREEIQVRVDDEVLNGTFAAMDEKGALILELATGQRRRISAGDVFFGAA